MADFTDIPAEQPLDVGKPTKRRVDYERAKSLGDRTSRATLPGEEGSLTEPLSRQWKFVLRLVESSLEAGLTAPDALERGTSALHELRRLAVDKAYDSHDQAMVKRLIVATCKSLGAETGEVLARRAVDAWTRVREWKLGEYRAEKVRQAKGKPL